MAAPASHIVLGTGNFSWIMRLDEGANIVYFTAGADGSLCEIIPIEDEIYKRLQLLQGQLSRNVQQVAGLNPKAFRYEGGGIVRLWG